MPDKYNISLYYSQYDTKKNQFSISILFIYVSPQQEKTYREKVKTINHISKCSILAEKRYKA